MVEHLGRYKLICTNPRVKTPSIGFRSTVFSGGQSNLSLLLEIVTIGFFLLVLYLKRKYQILIWMLISDATGYSPFPFAAQIMCFSDSKLFFTEWRACAGPRAFKVLRRWRLSTLNTCGSVAIIRVSLVDIKRLVCDRRKLHLFVQFSSSGFSTCTFQL